MNTFTIDDIRELGPCYDPSRHLPEDWSGDILDILAMSHIPVRDRMWVMDAVLHEDEDVRACRILAAKAVESVSHLLKPGVRSGMAAALAIDKALDVVQAEEVIAGRDPEKRSDEFLVRLAQGARNAIGEAKPCQPTA